jgi:hypothetical protein
MSQFAVNADSTQFYLVLVVAGAIAITQFKTATRLLDCFTIAKRVLSIR